ncbi:MAG: TonB-dependent siderophore receptor [Rhizobacter sp.]|nr:TonB-dependent siderophore receptor [Rhizobacter sp.]
MASSCSSHRSYRLSRTLTAAATLLLALGAHAQVASLPSVTVTGRSPSSTADVSGFGDTPLADSPLQARALTTEQLKDSGTGSLAGITRFDASLSDAYNAEGYWSNFTVRGFVIDPRYNFRRDGLPINAETSLPLANKDAVEVLKGTSGIQAGTSAPGGLVNLVVKRPEGNMRSAALGWMQDNSWGAAVDLSQRFGEADAFGLRLNLQHDELAPRTHDLKGRATLAALAGDWRVAPGTLIEAEAEVSRKSQPSQAGMSLLGSTLPDASSFDPRINLNNQPWSQPVVLDGNTASLRVRQRLSADWEAIAHLGTQRLRSDDRMAFPYGCSAENNYDRYCSDGSFDVYDFRSENERRRTDALDVGLRGRFATGALAHTASAGVLVSRFEATFQRQAYNYVGTGTIDGSTVTADDPTLTDENTNRTERSTELYLRDAINLTPQWALWLGLRHSRIGRESVRTDGSRPIDYRQRFTTPWLALRYTLHPGLIGYASWGQGIESEVTPNRARYTNSGQALPPLKTRQVEAGVKHAGEHLDWSLSAFSITRPRFGDVGSDCFTDTPGNTCTHQEDGEQRHRGLEAEAEWKLPGVAFQASAMLLHARVEGITSDPSLNGKQPTNVPEHSLRLNARHDVAAIAGLRLTGGIVYEGARMALPDNSVSIPGWTRLDAALRYEQKLQGSPLGSLVWRVGVDNLTDKRAWKESPYQFGHAYLYPLAPRTFRVSVEASL